MTYPEPVRHVGFLLILLPSLALAEGTARRIADQELDESSGLVGSRKHPGVFWSHNDSGGDPVLYAMGADGAARGRVSVTGARAVDWEDIAIDDEGNLWIHDGGNNSNKRTDLTVYRVQEPDALEGSVKVDRVARFHFPEQTAFPPKEKNFDSEALFWDRGRLMVLTKHRADTRTVLYAFPEGVADAVVGQEGEELPSFALERIGEFDVGGNRDNYGGRVTGADLSPDGSHLAVLTYHAAFVFPQPAQGRNWLAETPRRIDFVQVVTQQCEAISWDDGGLLFTNEGRALMRIANPLDDACTRYPGPGCR